MLLADYLNNSNSGADCISWT